VPIEDSVGALSDMVKKGHVRSIGLSEVGAQTLQRAHAVHPIAAVQTEYSLWTRNPEIAVLQACRDLGVTFVAFSPTARAFLTGQLRDVSTLDAKDIRRSMPRYSPENHAANLKLLDGYRALAREAGCTPAQLALAWLLHKGPDILPIPGTTRVEHLHDNLGAERVTLSASLIERLEAQPGAAPLLIMYAGEAMRQLGGEHRFLGEARCLRLLLARAVILAAGAGAFGPNRPPLEGLAGYEASGAVRYLVNRREDFRGKRVVIAGGGDSAVDWALALKDIAQVSVIHRRPLFRAAPETAAQLDAAAERGEVEMVIPYQLHALHGGDGRLTEVEVATLKGDTRRLPADILLPFFGLSMDLGPIAAWGLERDMSHIRVDPATCQTSLPGVFAIGDVATYPGKLKLILQGFSEAAMAAHAIHPIVRPDEALHFEYSTSKGVAGFAA